MKITLLGATGDLGLECLKQSIAAGHDITLLVRTPAKLSAELAAKVQVVQGDGLELEDVRKAIPAETQGILFAVGVDEKTSPENLCTNVTKNIFQVMRETLKPEVPFVWCGGGSNLLPEDVVSFGSKFVYWYAELFLKLRHKDKERQLEFLDNNKDIN
ncbi:NAD(P)-dependent oxidoreductase [Thalassotalea agarivorans]|uniref:NADH(P)-binding n=1 Tax=Thalassotalea agarivorans TaxID=349064 RepID=A0A1H9Y908_THASX|nr:NAD(P)H-binding protein [Thalassotalea agarivorans]SES65310.1 NADH(P)-binding [Thalassotalea agarivorans]